MEQEQWYGQWGMVLIMATIFLWLIFKFLKPQRKKEWQNSGILGAFIIALYAEMYGFPLTIYILSSVFGIDIPFTHLEGHLWSSLLGLGRDGAMAEMIIGYLVIIIGGVLVIAGWREIYFSKKNQASKYEESKVLTESEVLRLREKAFYKTKDRLVTDGIYAYMRHPQYAGIILIITGMLIHWPTLITLFLWPILTLAYYYLAKREEKEMKAKFDKSYQEYKNKVSMFWPSWKTLFTRPTKN